MSDETRVYNVIGDTRRKLDDACEMLVQTAGDLRQPGMDSIASYLHKGPDKSVWLILVGPFNAMCNFASETAREFAAHINEQMKNREE